MDDKTTANDQSAESNMVDPVRGSASNGASEAKGLGGISKDGTQPNAAGVPLQAKAPEAEVHILEEHVTHAAQKPTSSQAPAVRHAPEIPQTKPITPAPAAVTPPVIPTIPKVRPQPIPPSPATPALVPATTPSLPVEAQANATAADVGLVLPKPKVPGPKAPPKPSSDPKQEKPLSSPKAPKLGAPSAEEPALGNDIAKILAAVKLPERRDAAIPNEKKAPSEPKKFDTSIAGSVLSDAGTAPLPATPPQGAEPVSPNASSGAAAPHPGEAKTTGGNPSSVTAVHTLKDDLQGVVYDQKISLVKAVSLEEDRKAHAGSKADEISGAQQRSSRTFGILFASLTLLGLGAGALFGVLFIMNQKKAAPQIDTGSSILFAEQNVLLSLDAQSSVELKRVLEAGRTTSQGALGSITRIVPVIAATSSDGAPQNRPATFKEFMSAIGAHPPDEVVRALGNDFFLGIHAADKSAPLIVIPVASHARAFEAMLAWEDILNTDLAPLFTAVSGLRQDENGLPVKREYEDLVMRNYDVRALKDDRGDIQMYYSFPTQNILIIAESPYSFPEILSRLQASRQL